MVNLYMISQTFSITVGAMGTNGSYVRTRHADLYAAYSYHIIVNQNIHILKLLLKVISGHITCFCFI